MPFLFKQKVTEAKVEEIPGWEDPPFCTLAGEWARRSGLCEAWDARLRRFEPLHVTKALQTVERKEKDDVSFLARRGWCLLTAYRRAIEDRDKIQTEKALSEKENLDLQSRLAMIQCQYLALGDQARNYQAIAEKAAVRVAKYKYRKRRGKVNERKVHMAIVSAGPKWDPDTWDG